ncbi:MAG: cyclic nucleotide-binding domain-containing protein [Candidatus Magnetomorum sp.]|nr:cyclic nucleotide-binding domain-containing protein [Candidatus Magnetomorum sp.]
MEKKYVEPNTNNLTLMEKMFALKTIGVFNGLSYSELYHISENAIYKVFSPGQKFCNKNQVLKLIYIVIKGKIQSVSGQVMPRVLGAASMLFEAPVSDELIASPQKGATCMIIEKSHFYTIFNQYPSILRKLSEIKNLEVENVQ